MKIETIELRTRSNKKIRRATKVTVEDKYIIYTELLSKKEALKQTAYNLEKLPHVFKKVA